MLEATLDAIARAYGGRDRAWALSALLRASGFERCAQCACLRRRERRRRVVSDAMWCIRRERLSLA